MGLIRTHNKKVVLANADYKHKYWPILSKLVFEKFGNTQINEPNAVQETLKECFSTLCKIFEEKLSEEKELLSIFSAIIYTKIQLIYGVYKYKTSL